MRLRRNVRTSLFYFRRKLSTKDGRRKGCAHGKDKRERDRRTDTRTDIKREKNRYRSGGATAARAYHNNISTL